jgi:myo-inositol 2-dehydrogenase/D-chiro-inositol 1-dehydrogenase
VDAILVCTPTTTHADLIERGARAGKAVFCEKPVDLSSARIEACLATVEKAGTPLMIGFNRRFDPNFAAFAAAWPTARWARWSWSRSCPAIPARRP